jgi:plasmid replication initiation protein
LSAPRRRQLSRIVVLDRSLEALPLFRLSDSADDSAIDFTAEGGGRWRVLPAPGERLPGTFDQDVYVELLRRFNEAESPADGALSFTLHAFLRSMGRRVDGRTYEQLRAALTRLERTTLESHGVYHDATAASAITGQLTVLSSVHIDRRRLTDREQLALCSTLTNNEPGDARIVFSSTVRANLAAGHSITLSAPRYFALNSPVARRIYRLLEVARADAGPSWRVPLERLAALLPLVQRYPSHLQRVLQPAHEMLVAGGILRDASFEQDGKSWFAEYSLGPRAT